MTGVQTCALPIFVQTLLSSLTSQDHIYVYWGADPAFRYYLRTSAQPPSWVAGAYSPGDFGPHRTQLDALMRQPGPWWLVFSHADAAEVQAVLAYVETRRRVTLARQEDNAWLYRAE